MNAMNGVKRMNLGGSIVSKNLLSGKGNLKRCVRHASMNDLDNGWVFLADIDTDEFLKDPQNLVVCAWDTVVEIEPAVLAIFNLPVGTDLMLVKDGNRRYFVDNKTGKEVKLW